jgi:hypothetical protein
MNDKIFKHYVILHKASVQPSPDHVAFVAGALDADLKVEVPEECLYIPLATWMGLGTPETVTVTVSYGRHLPEEASR